MDRFTEELLVLMARQGHREAFDRLVDHYDRRLLYFVRRILGNDHNAFDVVQFVWMTVFRKIPHLKKLTAFRVWLYRIAHDQAVSELRKKSRERDLFTCETSAEVPVDGCAEHAFENAELVHLGLQRLSLDERRVLTLRFLEEMTIEEIAEVISCKVGTVKSRLYFAKQSLKTRIEELLNES